VTNIRKANLNDIDAIVALSDLKLILQEIGLSAASIWYVGAK